VNIVKRYIAGSMRLVFSFAASRESDRKCAEGLWKACTFTVTY